VNRVRLLTRRQMLRQSAASLLAAGLWPGALSAEQSSKSGEFHFLVVNDVHYFDTKCGRWLEGVITQMKKHKETIDFCLLAGDLAEHGRAEQIGAVKDIFKTLGKPTHVVIGNHDYLTETDRKAFEQLFPNLLNYRFEHQGWQFLGLDTTEGQRATGTAIGAHTLRWLHEQMPRLDRKRPTIVFTHFPLGPFVIGRPTNASAVLDRLKEFNLQAAFSGHWHGFTERHVRGTTLTTNRCCSFRRQNHDGSREKGYFLCHARDGKVERRFVEVKPA
jgi:3',5'-cyclic AMP phosphodiesterase CpdA